MSYELIKSDPHLPREISDYDYARIKSRDQVKYRRKAGSTTDHSDRSHVGTSSGDDSGSSDSGSSSSD